MASIMEIMQLCRLCLIKEQVNIPIFEDQGDIRQIFLKITACLPVKVSKEDQLPKKICDGCLYKLELLYQFWNTTANAEKQLLSWIEQSNMDLNSKPSEESSINTHPQVKQEKIEPTESTNENADLSADAQNYILQQQQLAYQANFPYKESQGSNVEGDDAVEDPEEPEPKRRRRGQRRQATKPIPPESLDSSDNEAADTLMEMTVTKTEEESESDGDENVDDPESSKFVTVAEDREQPGPSGLGKGTTEAPIYYQDSTYSNFAYQQNMVPQVDDSISSKYYMMMKNTPDIPDSNLLENAVAQLNDSDTDLLTLLAAEDDILRDITENEQFEQLITNGVIETGNEYIETVALQENISALIKNDSFPEFCNKEQILTETNSIIEKETPTPLISISRRSKTENFKCTYCERVCSTKKLLKNHTMIHTGTRPFSCEICSKTFRHNYELTVHKKSHNKPTFQCDICSRMFIHKSHLTAHRRKHIGDFVVACEKCNKGFISQSAYNEHVRVKHQNIMHICEACGARLSSLSALKEHKLTHDPNYHQERPHICEFCGKSYLNARHLRGHMKSHTDFKSYVCNLCGKSLTTKSNLRKHIANHSDEKKFQCSYCNKNFSSKENLSVHERIHTKDKPFSCNVCSKTFSQKNSVTVHMRYHTGERPYKCVCGKEFFTKSNLLVHSKIH